LLFDVKNYQLNKSKSEAQEHKHEGQTKRTSEQEREQHRKQQQHPGAGAGAGARSTAGGAAQQQQHAAATAAARSSSSSTAGGESFMQATLQTAPLRPLALRFWWRRHPEALALADISAGLQSARKRVDSQSSDVSGCSGSYPEQACQ
jgi:hypothetical protein